MSLSDLAITRNDLDNAGWEAVIESCDDKDCARYADLFFAKAREAETAGNPGIQATFILLGAITSLMLQPESKDEPFGPLAVFGSARSAIVDDFSDPQLAVLKDLLPEIRDAELRARIADILWLRRKGDFRMAEAAIDAYLQSADVLEDPVNWPECVKRIRRALRLSVTLGRNSQRFPVVIQHIENVLDKHQGEDPLFLSASLMELLLEYRQGDPARYAVLAGKLGDRAETERKWHLARTHWDNQARWYSRAQRPEEERIARIRLAETFVQEAEDTLHPADSHNHSVAAHHLQRAVEALRRVAGTEQRRRELHKTLLTYQERSVDELRHYSTTVDLTQSVSQAMAQVSGKTLHAALLSLATIYPLPRMLDLKAQVEEFAKQHPLQFIFPSSMLNESGRVVARRPGLMSNDTKEAGAAIRAEMLRYASRYRDLIAAGMLEPARYQINLEHRVQPSDWLPLVSNNPFVPEGRELIYVQGLQAGLQGDYLVAVHLLVPQLEHSLRYIMNQRGIPTSSLDAYGIQQEWDLNKLLYLPELEQTLGEDAVFNLQGLLVEEFGDNLRNRMAHGLAHHGEFLSSPALYSWWLILRLCCLPILHAERKAALDQQE